MEPTVPGRTLTLVTRSRALLTTLAFALALCAAPAGAATLRVGDVLAQPGDTIDIPILLEDVGPLVTDLDLDATLLFDPAVLTNFVAVLPGALDATPNAFYVPDALPGGPGLLNFNLGASFNMASDVNAQVVLLRFDVAPGAAFGAYPLGLSDAGVALEFLPTATAEAGGTLNLVPIPLPGGLALLAGALPFVWAGTRRTAGQRRTL